MPSVSLYRRHVMASLRVAVVGCGTAGPAAALHLARRLVSCEKRVVCSEASMGSVLRSDKYVCLSQDCAVEIFDRTVTPSAVGAGIGVQPIGLTALKKLGLLEEVLAHGARIEAIRTWVKNDRATEGVWAGRRCLDIEYARYDPRLFGVGLAR